jgi:O-antigen/teichoic acid export membrane protein
MAGAVTGVGTVVLFAASLFVLWAMKGEATIATVLTLSVCSGVVNTLIAGWLLRRKIASLPEQISDKSTEADYKVVLAEVLAISWPLLITGLVMFARTNMDLWILGIFRPQAEVAVYGAANRLVSMVTMPLIMVNSVVPPLIADMYARGRKRELEGTLRGMSALTGIPAILAAAVCVFFAAPILGLVYGNFYREGAVVLALLSLGVLAGVFAGSAGQTLSMTGHQKSLMVITTTTSIVSFVAMVLLIKPFGLFGLAISRMAGQILQNGLMLLMVKYRTGMWTHAGFGKIPYLLGYGR